MPFGPEPVGFAAFVLVKFAGYSGAGHMLNQAYESPKNYWKVGAVRTAIGIAAGGAYFGAYVMGKIDPGPVAWFAGLVPVRLLEWGLLLRIFFDKRSLATTRSWKWAALGTGWSFALDALGVGAALVVPGGMWVC